MPSLLVRLRRRAISLTSGESFHTQTGLGLAQPPTGSVDTIPQGQTVSVAYQQPTPVTTPVARHIVPDINALMDTYASEPSVDQESSQGLRLPRTRKRSLLDSIATVVGSGGQNSPQSSPVGQEGSIPETPTLPRTRKRSLLDTFATVVGSARDPEPIPTEVSEGQDSLDDDIFTSSIGAPERSTSRLSKYGIPRLSQLSSTSTWSTFGRQKKKTAPRLSRITLSSSARHSRVGSIDSSAQPSGRPRQSSVTSVNYYHASPSRISSVEASHSAPSTISRASSRKVSYDDHDLNHAPQTHSPPLTSSSRQNSIAQISVLHSSPSRRSHPDSHTSSNSNPKTGVESPRTFGNITPPQQRSGVRSSSVSPPPLPPLDHPELVATLAFRSRITTQESTEGGIMHVHTRTGSSTFPRRIHRRRTLTSGSTNDENISPTDTLSIEHSRGRVLRASSSLPQVRDGLPLAPSPVMTPRLLLPGRLPASRSRPSSRHSTRSRRSSAEWSAQQASIGVTSANIHEFGWPAEVSREMVRLSLHEGEEPEGIAESSLQRGRHVPGPHAHASGSSSCFPAPGPLSPPPLPPPPDPSSFTSPTHREDPLPSRGDTLSTLFTENPASDRDHLQDGDTCATQPDERRFVTDTQSLSETGPGLAPLVGNGERTSRMSVPDVESPRSRSKSNPSQRSSATLPRTTNSTRAPRRSILNPATPVSEPGPSTPQRKTSTSPNTNVTPKHSAMKPRRTSSEPGLLSVMETPTNQKGKRKAEEVDITPPDQKTGQRATFVIPENGRRTHHESESSHAPSSYHRKRVRLSTTTPTPSPSRPGSSQNIGSMTSRTAPSPIPGHLSLHRTGSRATSTRSHQQGTLTPASSSHDVNRRSMVERRSMSEMSIPISALIAPHAPSISRSSTYHMRDPRRPPAVRPTSWSLHFQNEDEDGSPLHAWCFFLGFVLFPLWWVASFLPIPQTRRVGGTDTEKAVTLDDPQVEHDARSWRVRCRIMSGVAFLTYIPFIVLIAVFVPR